MFTDINRLREAGYAVKQKSPWHFQVEGKTIVNIWPSRNKWMVAYGAGASFYHDGKHLLSIMENILGKPGEKRGRDPRWLLKKINAEWEASLTSEMRAAAAEHEKDLRFINWLIHS